MQYVNFTSPNSLPQTGGSSNNLSSSIHPESLDSVPLQSPNKNPGKEKFNALKMYIKYSVKLSFL